MFSALTSYIWGMEEENNTEKPIIQIKDQIELEDDWIYIQHKGTLFLSSGVLIFCSFQYFFSAHSGFRKDIHLIFKHLLRYMLKIEYENSMAQWVTFKFYSGFYIFGIHNL